MIIEKPDVNIVAVIVNKSFNWYICSKDMWYMDINKLIKSYKDAGWNFDLSFLPEVQHDIYVISKNNLNSYFAAYSGKYEKVSVSQLKEEIVYSQLFNDCIPEEFRLDDELILPDLLIDFDNKLFYSHYWGLTCYECYVPDGWKSYRQNFEKLIPRDEQYWLVKEGKYYVRK